jgi:hypothetical protein
MVISILSYSKIPEMGNKINSFIIILLLLFCSQFGVQAQSFAFNADGSLPHPSAALDIKSTGKGLLLPRLSTAQRNGIVNPANGLLLYDNTLNLLYNYRTNNQWTAAIDNSYWQLIGGNILYTLNNDVGIGTSAPLERLHIASGNFKIENGDLTLLRSSGLTQFINFSNSNTSPGNFVQGFDFNIGGVRNASVHYNTSNTTGEDAISLGLTGIPGNNFLLKSKGEMVLNSTNPILQLQQSGVSTGFIQLSGDDIRLGTNIGNNAGRLIVRLNGNNLHYITPAGRLGINESDPDELLHVNGNIYATGNINVGAQLRAADLTFSQKISNPSISNAALTPHCYGTVWENGSHRSVTPNATVTRISTGAYMISCPGITENSVIMITVANERYYATGTFHSAGNASVGIFYDSSTAPPPRRDSDFCFVIFKL